jgi:hypothetical protein
MMKCAPFIRMISVSQFILVGNVIQDSKTSHRRVLIEFRLNEEAQNETVSKRKYGDLRCRLLKDSAEIA